MSASTAPGTVGAPWGTLADGLRRAPDGYTATPGAAVELRGPVDDAAVPCLADYRVCGSVVTPPAMYIDALARGANVVDSAGVATSGCTLRDVRFAASMWFRPGCHRDVTMTLREDHRAQISSSVASGAAGSATTSASAAGRSARSVLHATCAVARAANTGRAAGAYKEAKAVMAARAPLAGREWYAGSGPGGTSAWQTRGAAFRAVTRLWHGPSVAVASLAVPGGASRATGTGVHPVLLDACCHLVSAAAGVQGAAYFPSRIQSCTIVSAPANSNELLVYVRVRGPASAASTVVADVTLFDASGGVVVVMEGLACKALRGNPKGSTSGTSTPTRHDAATPVSSPRPARAASNRALPSGAAGGGAHSHPNLPHTRTLPSGVVSRVVGLPGAALAGRDHAGGGAAAAHLGHAAAGNGRTQAPASRNTRALPSGVVTRVVGLPGSSAQHRAQPGGGATSASERNGHATPPSSATPPRSLPRAAVRRVVALPGEPVPDAGQRAVGASAPDVAANGAATTPQTVTPRSVAASAVRRVVGLPPRSSDTSAGADEAGTSPAAAAAPGSPSARTLGDRHVRRVVALPTTAAVLAPARRVPATSPTMTRGVGASAPEAPPANVAATNGHAPGGGEAAMATQAPHPSPIVGVPAGAVRRVVALPGGPAHANGHNQEARSPGFASPSPSAASIPSSVSAQFVAGRDSHGMVSPFQDHHLQRPSPRPPRSPHSTLPRGTSAAHAGQGRGITSPSPSPARSATTPPAGAVRRVVALPPTPPRSSALNGHAPAPATPPRAQDAHARAMPAALASLMRTPSESAPSPARSAVWTPASPRPFSPGPHGRRAAPVSLDALSTWIASATRSLATGHIRAGHGELQVYVLVPPAPIQSTGALALRPGRYKFDPAAEVLAPMATPQVPSASGADRLRAALTDDASPRAAKEAASLAFAVLLLSDVSAPPPRGAGAGAGAGVGVGAGAGAGAAAVSGSGGDAHSTRPRAMSSSSLAPALHYEARALLRALKRARAAASALSGFSFVQHHNYDPLAHRWVAKLRTALGLSRSAIILRGLHVLPAAAVDG